MADEKKNVDKEALKAQKQAEKDALKAKKERIKQSKPKKDGNIFVRIGRAIKKFFKDFKGTCKKVIWPDRKTVLKNTLVVFLTVLIVGIGIWIVDFAFTKGVGLLTNAAKTYAEEQLTAEDEAADQEDSAAETTTAAAVTTTAAEITSAEPTT